MDNSILDDFSEISDSADDGFVVDVRLLETEKFLILMIASMGLYGFWWMYKVWQFFKKKDRLDIVPWARAIFGFIYMYGLIEKIKQQAKRHKYYDNYMSLPLTVFYFGSWILLLLPSLLSLFFIVGVMAMVKPHEAFNHLAENSERVRAIYQDRYHSRQVLMLIFGVIIWIAAIIWGYITLLV